MQTMTMYPTFSVYPSLKLKFSTYTQYTFNIPKLSPPFIKRLKTKPNPPFTDYAPCPLLLPTLAFLPHRPPPNAINTTRSKLFPHPPLVSYPSSHEPNLNPLSLFLSDQEGFTMELSWLLGCLR